VQSFSTIGRLKRVTASVIAVLCFFAGTVGNGFGQQAQNGGQGMQEVIPLWSRGVPGALGTLEQDSPRMLVYLPRKEIAMKTAIVLCQGGSYGGYYEGQGEPFARWLNEHGIAVFLLKYRLGSVGYRYPAQLNDLSRAVRIARSRAEEWGVKQTRIGVMGFSAGGHLVSSLCVRFDAGDPAATDPIDRHSCRPDFAVLCYPVISMLTKPHGGSLGNLLGNNPSAELLQQASSELNVRSDTPPCFVWHTVEDTLVPPDHSLLFAAALLKAKVPCELHLYEKGPHGTGLMGTNHPWMNDLLHWLRERDSLVR